VALLVLGTVALSLILSVVAQTLQKKWWWRTWAKRGV